MGRIWITLGGLAGAGAVGLAATAAHALPASLDAKAIAAIQSAIQLQAWHALALLFTGLWVLRATGLPRWLGHIAGAGFTAGTLLFSGAILGHHLGGFTLGPAAPIGGTLLIAAWLSLAISALSAR